MLKYSCLILPFQGWIQFKIPRNIAFGGWVFGKQLDSKMIYSHLHQNMSLHLFSMLVGLLLTQRAGVLTGYSVWPLAHNYKLQVFAWLSWDAKQGPLGKVWTNSWALLSLWQNGDSGFFFGIADLPVIAGSTFRISTHCRFRGRCIGGLHLLVSPDIQQTVLYHAFSTVCESLPYTLSENKMQSRFCQ